MEFADRNAIESLIFRYTRYVDTCQWHDLGQLFAAAAITLFAREKPRVSAQISITAVILSFLIAVILFCFVGSSSAPTQRPRS